MDAMGNPLDDRREELRDFVDRYERGAPYDGISEEEAARRYREVVPELSGEEYRQSAREAFSRMQPEERAELGKQLRDQAQQQGFDLLPEADSEERYGDPDHLVRLVERMRREHPDQLEALIGDGGAGLVGGMMGEGITGCEGAASDGGTLGNPAAKAALADIAAIGFKRMEGSR